MSTRVFWHPLACPHTPDVWAMWLSSTYRLGNRMKCGVASALTWKVLQPLSGPTAHTGPHHAAPCEVLGTEGPPTPPQVLLLSPHQLTEAVKLQARLLPWRVCRRGPCTWCMYSRPAPPRGPSATSWGMLPSALVCWQLSSRKTSECSSICLAFSEAENLCVPQKSNGCSFHKLT